MKSQRDMNFSVELKRAQGGYFGTRRVYINIPYINMKLGMNYSLAFMASDEALHLVVFRIEEAVDLVIESVSNYTGYTVNNRNFFNKKN